MFLGHFAVALGAKKLAPSTSLGTLFLAAQLADLVWPTLVLAGVERVAVTPGSTPVTPLQFLHYPYSHSLLALALWAALLAGVYAVTRRLRTAAAVVGALVLSHWLLDVVTHEPDMPLDLGGGLLVGLGLWRSLPATLLVELALFAAGLAVYTRVTRARDRAGRVALWALAAFLVAVYLAALFGPLPPSPAAVAWSAQAVWLLVAAGWWVDRHRRSAASDGA